MNKICPLSNSGEVTELPCNTDECELWIIDSEGNGHCAFNWLGYVAMKNYEKNYGRTRKE